VFNKVEAPIFVDTSKAFVSLAKNPSTLKVIEDRFLKSEDKKKSKKQLDLKTLREIEEERFLQSIVSQGIKIDTEVLKRLKARNQKEYERTIVYKLKQLVYADVSSKRKALPVPVLVTQFDELVNSLEHNFKSDYTDDNADTILGEKVTELKQTMELKEEPDPLFVAMQENYKKFIEQRNDAYEDEERRQKELNKPLKGVTAQNLRLKQFKQNTEKFQKSLKTMLDSTMQKKFGERPKCTRAKIRLLLREGNKLRKEEDDLTKPKFKSRRTRLKLDLAKSKSLSPGSIREIQKSCREFTKPFFERVHQALNDNKDVFHPKQLHTQEADDVSKTHDLDIEIQAGSSSNKDIPEFVISQPMLRKSASYYCPKVPIAKIAIRRKSRFGEAVVEAQNKARGDSSYINPNGTVESAKHLAMPDVGDEFDSKRFIALQAKTVSDEDPHEKTSYIGLHDTDHKKRPIKTFEYQNSKNYQSPSPKNRIQKRKSIQHLIKFNRTGSPSGFPSPLQSPELNPSSTKLIRTETPIFSLFYKTPATLADIDSKIPAFFKKQPSIVINDPQRKVEQPKSGPLQKRHPFLTEPSRADSESASQLKVSSSSIKNPLAGSQRSRPVPQMDLQVPDVPMSFYKSQNQKAIELIAPTTKRGILMKEMQESLENRRQLRRFKQRLLILDK